MRLQSASCLRRGWASWTKSWTKTIRAELVVSQKALQAAKEQTSSLNKDMSSDAVQQTDDDALRKARENAKRAPGEQRQLHADQDQLQKKTGTLICYPLMQG